MSQQQHDGSVWAGWDSSAASKSNAGRPDDMKQPRSRSYQESRRHERDRRDNLRRAERQPDTEDTTTATGQGMVKEPATRTDKRPLRSKSDSAHKVSSADGQLVDRQAEGDMCHRNWPQDGTRDDVQDDAKADRSAVTTCGVTSRGTKLGKGDGPSTATTLDSVLTCKSEDEGDEGEAASEDTEDSESPRYGANLLSLLQDKAQATANQKDKQKDGTAVPGVGQHSSDLETQWLQEVERKNEAELQAKQSLAEEEKKQKEMEAEKAKEEELRQLMEFVAETEERLAMRTSMRDLNRNTLENRPDEMFYSKLDSSLKKNTAFVKKLRNLTENQKESLVKDFNSLNLSKYMAEVATAITEAKLKMSDIGCALHICSLLHRRYADFSSVLLEHWQRVLLSKKDDKVPNPSKLRVDLRFFADLITLGVFPLRDGLQMLAGQLTLLTSSSGRGEHPPHHNLAILLSFSKHCGDDYAGLLSQRYRLLGEKYNVAIPRSKMLPAERQKACRHLLKEYYASLCKHLLQEHSELKAIEKQNTKILQTKGELATDRREIYENKQHAFQKLLLNTTMFADVLDEDMAQLPADDTRQDADTSGLDILNTMKGAEYQYDGDTSLFEDDDTRQFYETLPDLKALIPGILYKDSEHVRLQPSEKDKENEGIVDVDELEKEIKELEETDQKGGGGGVGKLDDDHLVEEHLETLDVDDEEGDVGSSMKSILDAFINKLPNCVNRELIDKAAIDFCMNLNTKVNRRKLVRGLFTVQRTRYDLLPFYSRFVAALFPCMPDVANELVLLLRSDFRWHVRKKDQINIESKLKTVRFIGELVKFNMYPKAEALHCLKLLMFDFSHHNIEMACSLLESAGRFLYRSPDSHHRTKVYLDVMMRKKVALHLDSRYATMIENAFYYSNPPNVKQEARRERPPVHEYIRRLLYKDLSKLTTEKVLKQMRKMNWDDPDEVQYTIRCMTNIWNLRYNSVHCCANLLAGLAPYHESVTVQVVDGVLEDIRLGMEMNHPRYNQRRVSAVKYLAELYNYRLFESSVIFKTLYSFITFGVSFDENEPTPLDPPEHLFRIRLVCVVLETCGQYFDRGSSKRRLDCYLLYFQRYYWFKRESSLWTEQRPFPVDIQYLMQDTLDALRPDLHCITSYQEALEAADQLDRQFRAKLAEVMPSADGDEEEEDTLPTIQESDEMDELSQRGGTGVSGGTQDSELDADGNSGSHSQNTEIGLRRNREIGEEDTTINDDDDDDIHLDSANEDDDDQHQVPVLTQGLKHLKCKEDDDFLTAFDSMLIENIQARTQEAVKVPQVDIAVPMHLKAQNKAKAASLPPLPGFPDEPENCAPCTPGSVHFVLMTKRGNKQQFSTLNVPVNADFATKYKEREQAERVEKEKMKRVVLDIHERQEEEDYQDMLASMMKPAAANLNRERRFRYQHPKGAPDADLIFGSK